MKRKVCVITGSRAEYGLLRALMERLRGSSAFELQTVVTGMHLAPAFGSTWKQIEKDGFPIARKIEMPLDDDSAVGLSGAMGAGLIGFGKAFAELAPDLAVVLGDRFELLSATAAALVSRVPVAHLHGGERTDGAFDDSIRHAVTKMSHLHFTSTEAYRRRVIQMGESPDRVFNVGAIGLDGIRLMPRMGEAELESALGIPLSGKILLVTFHPATLDDDPSARQFQSLLRALDGLKDAFVVFTKANADTGGREINSLIDAYAAANPHRCKSFASLGPLYLPLLSRVDAVVGNSSSGIIEAPSLGRVTVNIGDRQHGRIKADSVIDCPPETEAILAAIRLATSAEFKASLVNLSNPYGDGHAADKIVEILSGEDWGMLTRKVFHDLDIPLRQP